MEFLKKLFPGKKENSAILPAQPILPDSVRYALRYKQAMFGKEEIIALLHSPFFRLGTTLALKAIPNDERKLLILDKVVNGDLPCVKSLAADYISKSTKVNGMKAGQYSRQMEVIHEMFVNVANKIAVEPYTEPLLMAHTTLVGIDWFKDKFNNFGIVLPKESLDSGVPIGYYATRESVNSKFVVSNNLLEVIMESSNNFIAVDDTYKKGYQGRQIQRVFSLNEVPLTGYEYIVFSNPSVEP